MMVARHLEVPLYLASHYPYVAVKMSTNNNSENN
jgi:hypothetical protein